jgi:Xaa-Pro aminopeptidase
LPIAFRIQLTALKPVGFFRSNEEPSLPNLRRAKTLLAKDGVDFVVVSSPPNLSYFTQLKAGIQGVVGWWNMPKMLLLPVSKDTTPTLIVTIMDEWNILKEKSDLFEPVFYGGFILKFGGKKNEEIRRLERTYQCCLEDHKDAFGRFDEFVKSWTSESLTVGFESHHLPTEALNLLKKRHPSVNFKPVDGTLGLIRTIKTEQEIETIKRSAAINIRGLRAILDEIKPGVKEITLAQTYLREIATWDARPCHVMVNAGPESAALLPAYERPYKIKKGDTVRIDVGCECRGYCSDISRTVSVGKVSEEKRRIILATTRGYVEAEKMLRPSLPIRELYHFTVSTVKSAGLPDFERTNVGHGLGVEVEELPELTSQSKETLESNMVINVETSYYSFGVGGFPCEETVRVTENSYDLLTKLERVIEL